MSFKKWPENLLEILGEDGRLGVVTPEELEAALPKLAPKFEKIDRVILGYYREGKTPRELSAELNVTVGRIHQFRLYGLAVIRDRIKDARLAEKEMEVMMKYRRMRKTDRIYISGPISRDPVKARHDFARVERWLRWNKYDDVINPEKLLREHAKAMTHGDLLHICRSLVDTSDVVLLLEGWKESTGASMEAGMALALGKLVLEVREDGALHELNY